MHLVATVALATITLLLASMARGQTNLAPACTDGSTCDSGLCWKGRCCRKDYGCMECSEEGKCTRCEVIGKTPGPLGPCILPQDNGLLCNNETQCMSGFCNSSTTKCEGYNATKEGSCLPGFGCDSCNDEGKCLTCLLSGQVTGAHGNCLYPQEGGWECNNDRQCLSGRCHGIVCLAVTNATISSSAGSEGLSGSASHSGSGSAVINMTTTKAPRNKTHTNATTHAPNVTDLPTSADVSGATASQVFVLGAACLAVLVVAL